MEENFERRLKRYLVDQGLAPDSFEDFCKAHTKDPTSTEDTKHILYGRAHDLEDANRQMELHHRLNELKAQGFALNDQQIQKALCFTAFIPVLDYNMELQRAHVFYEDVKDIGDDGCKCVLWLNGHFFRSDEDLVSYITSNDPLVS